MLTPTTCNNCGEDFDPSANEFCPYCSVEDESFWDEPESDDDDTGYSPEDRETLRKDFEYQLYQQTYYADGEIVHDYPSDAQIAADEAEDAEFMRCHECGQLDCVCEDDDYV